MSGLSTVASTRLNLAQRLLNRLGRPVGLNPFPVAWELSGHSPGDSESVFETIFRANYWGSQESVSGPGSELKRTERYRKQLIHFLRDRQVKSLFDAPCGDLNWMAEVLSAVSVDYIGGDISPAVIDNAKEKRPGLDLRRFDICLDSFPDVDVWHCRDALFHLSFHDVWAALENVSRSDIQLVMLTTHRARYLKNLDIATGGWRYLDLERAPFNLPRASQYLEDTQPGEFPRAVGVWPIEDIRGAVASRPS